MEEKIIIESKRYNVLKIFLISMIAVAILAVIMVLIWKTTVYDPAYDDFYRYYGKSEFTARENAMYNSLGLLFLIVILPVGTIFITMSIFCLVLKSMQIVVTDKHVYGKTYFGKSVDLPIDSISAVGSKWMKGITVSTSSGKISFLLIKNAQKIHAQIRKLLIERQENKNKVEINTVSMPVQTSAPEELKKYKELLDGGVITQEEYELKKKQILGI